MRARTLRRARLRHNRRSTVLEDMRGVNFQTLVFMTFTVARERNADLRENHHSETFMKRLY
jgi:hypothetical protein